MIGDYTTMSPSSAKVISFTKDFSQILKLAVFLMKHAEAT